LLLIRYAFFRVVIKIITIFLKFNIKALQVVRLGGRVICLEQLILKLIEVKGFEFVRDRILPMVSCDKSLQICFGVSSPVTEENVIAGLNSYINDIRQQTPNLLANL
jgi:hypothetical protein